MKDAQYVLAGILLGMSVSGSAAEQGGVSAQSDELARIKKQLNEEKKSLELEKLEKLIIEQKSSIQAQWKQLQALEKQLQQYSQQQPSQKKAPPQKKAPSTASTKTQTRVAESSKVKPVGKAAADSTTKPPKVAAINDDIRGILTPKRTLIVEPSLKYSHSSSSRVFLEGFGPLVLPSFFLGLIDIRETNRDAVIGALTARYGLTNRLQLEAKLPYVWRSDSIRTRSLTVELFGDDVFEADGKGLGDIELALDYQFNNGLNGWPFFTGSLRVKTPSGTSPYDVDAIDIVATDPEGNPILDEDGNPFIQRFPTELATGTGFWSVQPSLTFLYPTDPAVFFGSVQYVWNIADTVGEDIGKVDPGDAIGISGGMGFGINERSSFSLGFSYKHGFETVQGGSSINGTSYDIGQISIGYAFRLTNDTNMNLSVGVGATADAPDFELTLRVPTNFAL